MALFYYQIGQAMYIATTIYLCGGRVKMGTKMLIAAMVIIAILNFVAFFDTGSTFSLIIAIGLLVLSASFALKLRRQ